MNTRIAGFAAIVALLTLAAMPLTAMEHQDQAKGEGMKEHMQTMHEGHAMQGMDEHPKEEVREHEHMFNRIHNAVCVLQPTEGNNVHGTVHFTDVDGGVKVVADISGLEPGQRHGFHVHEYGDITAADGTSAGGHYNPEGHDHALPDHGPRHAGDLGNLEADENGNAHLELVVDNLSVAGLVNPVIGRGMIVHAKPDDGGQPTGNAGGRVAMGVIGIAAPTE